MPNTKTRSVPEEVLDELIDFWMHNDGESEVVDEWMGNNEPAPLLEEDVYEPDMRHEHDPSL